MAGWMATVLMAVALASSPAAAQPAENAGDAAPTAQTHPYNPMMWDVDTMMEQAVQQISRRYSLNPKQEEYTRLLLQNRVKAFLAAHETEVRELLQESIDMRLGRAKADPASLKMWAERAMPLYQEASAAILEGNEEWGVILNDQQKKIHEGDLRLMRTSFEGVTGTLQAWARGSGPKLPPIKDPNAVAQNAAETGASQNGGSVSQNPKPVEAQYVEDNWLSYVNMFVAAYGLDEAAKTSARDKIYKEQFGKAKEYRKRRAANFERVEKQLKDLTPANASRRPAIQSRLKSLERPIYDLFIEMDERLHKLLTAAQVAEVDAEKKLQLERLHAALSGKKEVPAASSKSKRVRRPASPARTAPTAADKAEVASTRPADEKDEPTSAPTETSEPAKSEAAPTDGEATDSADADESELAAV